MTLASSLALFAALLVLAIVPGPGVFAVVARTLSSGARQGAIAVAGIVAGDYVFILLSVLGLTALANVMGETFVVVKYLGALYLFWLAISLWQTAGNHSTESDQSSPERFSSTSSFMAGLITTLGNPKAIFFYLGFFPAFMDLSVVGLADIAIIFALATIAVGGVMLGYVLAAYRARQLLTSSRARTAMNRTASGVMACSGALLLTRS